MNDSPLEETSPCWVVRPCRARPFCSLDGWCGILCRANILLNAAGCLGEKTEAKGLSLRRELILVADFSRSVYHDGYFIIVIQENCCGTSYSALRTGCTTKAFCKSSNLPNSQLFWSLFTNTMIYRIS